MRDLKVYLKDNFLRVLKKNIARRQHAARISKQTRGSAQGRTFSWVKIQETNFNI